MYGEVIGLNSVAIREFEKINIQGISFARSFVTASELSKAMIDGRDVYLQDIGIVPLRAKNDTVDLKDTVHLAGNETNLPPAQAQSILSLKQQLPGLLPPHVLTDAEKEQMLRRVTSIVDQTSVVGQFSLVDTLTKALSIDGTFIEPTSGEAGKLRRWDVVDAIETSRGKRYAIGCPADLSTVMMFIRPGETVTVYYTRLPDDCLNLLNAAPTVLERLVPGNLLLERLVPGNLSEWRKRLTRDKATLKVSEGF